MRLISRKLNQLLLNGGFLKNEQCRCYRVE